jgi:hypothetical protein
MTTTIATPADLASIEAIGGPVGSAWREGTLTRATELESLCAWLFPLGPEPAPELNQAVRWHLRAAREAAGRRRRFGRLERSGPAIERAISNLDAIEAHLLQVAPADYLLGQMPCLLNQVRRHLAPDDPRRQEMERIARRPAGRESHDERIAMVNAERRRIVSIVRGAASAALPEQQRVRRFVPVQHVERLVEAPGLRARGVRGDRHPAGSMYRASGGGCRLPPVDEVGYPDGRHVVAGGGDFLAGNHERAPWRHPHRLQRPPRPLIVMAGQGDDVEAAASCLARKIPRRQAAVPRETVHVQVGAEHDLFAVMTRLGRRIAPEGAQRQSQRNQGPGRQPRSLHRSHSTTRGSRATAVP